MPRIEEQIDISASPMDVFRFVHNTSHRADWDERVIAVRMLSQPPVRQGTLLNIDAGHGNMFQFSWDAEYSVFQFPASSTLRALDAATSSYFKRAVETMHFESAGGGTRVNLVWEYEPRGIIARIRDALGGRTGVRRAIRHSLENLRQMMESR
ncbi:MAG: hypothetical protein GX620_06150 [Chloroflexi bacterium]|nr:hypothetical protein [Chloroflexota bacterium]